jgi:hypothetical protein
MPRATSCPTGPSTASQAAHKCHASNPDQFPRRSPP